MIAIFTGILVWAAVTATFGVQRIITGLVLGVFVAIAVAGGLFYSDKTVLSEDAITIRTLRKNERVEWNRIGTVRFAWPEGSDHWLLTADLGRPTDPASVLLLLATPPVERPMSNAYEMRKREQLKDILAIMRTKGIRVIFAPGIATRLEEFWQVAPPED